MTPSTSLSASSPREIGKASFVNFLLKESKVEVDRKKTGPSAGSTSAYQKLKELLDALFERVKALSQMASDEVIYGLERNRTEVQALREDLKDLRQWIDRRLQKIPEEDTRLKGKDEKPSRDRQEERGAVSKNDMEGLKLKEWSLRLNRRYYEQRYARGRQASLPREEASAGQNVSHLIREIDRLEAKKLELIKDNIQINHFSEDLLRENNRLQQELKQLQAQLKSLE